MKGVGPDKWCQADIPVRVSIGSLAVLGLEKLRVEAIPHTLYMLQYSSEGCLAGCRFCAQSITSRAPKSMLSRVIWPTVSLRELVNSLKHNRRLFKRICLQTVVKPMFFHEVLCILKQLAGLGIPVSLATTPVHKDFLTTVKQLGVDNLGVGLDASTPALFEKSGKPYTWNTYIFFTRRALEVFGRGHVFVHIIAGLGEEPKDIVETMKYIYSMGARVALFKYTPLPGTQKYPGIDLYTYRAIQIARLLLEHGYDPFTYIDFDKNPPRAKRRIPLNTDELIQALITSGCPDCNRPFYNESPRGPLYNYPNKDVLERHKEKIIGELSRIGVV